MINLPYIAFLLYCLRTRFIFFTYKPHQQARILKKRKLYRWAGNLYLKQGNFTQAIHCLKATSSYKELVPLCQRIGNLSKAAFFLSYYKPLASAKLYKQIGLYYEAGQSYLKAYQFISATQCFFKVLDPIKQQQGLRQIEEIGITLYLSHHYNQAFKLFMKLKDYGSAWECAKKLREPSLIESTQLLMAWEEEKQGHYLLAGKYYEPYQPQKALTCYYLGHHTEAALRLLIAAKDYNKAVNLCLQYNQLALAYELMSKYQASLDPSFAFTS